MKIIYLNLKSKKKFLKGSKKEYPNYIYWIQRKNSGEEIEASMREVN